MSIFKQILPIRDGFVLASLCCSLRSFSLTTYGWTFATWSDSVVFCLFYWQAANKVWSQYTYEMSPLLHLWRRTIYVLEQSGKEYWSKPAALRIESEMLLLHLVLCCRRYLTRSGLCQIQTLHINYQTVWMFDRRNLQGTDTQLFWEMSFDNREVLVLQSNWKLICPCSLNGKEEDITTSIFVRNLPEDITSEKLLEVFSQYGTVRGGIQGIQLKAPKGRAPEFAFVAYEELASMQSAIATKTLIDEKAVTVVERKPQLNRYPPRGRGDGRGFRGRDGRGRGGRGENIRPQTTGGRSEGRPEGSPQSTKPQSSKSQSSKSSSSSFVLVSTSPTSSGTPSQQPTSLTPTPFTKGTIVYYNGQGQKGCLLSSLPIPANFIQTKSDLSL